MHGDAAGAQHHGSTPGEAGKPQHTGLGQQMRKKPSRDSLTQRRRPRGEPRQQRNIPPPKQLGHKPNLSRLP